MNDVVNDARVSFEDALARLAYKLLQVTYDNMSTNIYFQSADGKKFWTLHKEAFRDALKRFNIKVEANSSSSVDVESRRQDAIAMKNIGMEALKVGASLDKDMLFKNIFKTFEGVDINKLFTQNLLPAPALP
jgi:hypothetical protein